MRLHHKIRSLTMLVAAALLAASCATGPLSSQPASLEETQGGQELKEAPPLYYDFKDVPVPRELDIVNEKSFVFQTTESTIGLLAFSGGLNVEFLIDFFTSRMPDTGWRLLSSFRSPRIMLFFLKESRFCIITIAGRAFGTEVEILLTPNFGYPQP
jgi:hypothetical protein